MSIGETVLKQVTEQFTCERRFAVPAFLIIATVRGVLLNFGVYYAARAALGLTEFQWSPAIGCAHHGCSSLAVHGQTAVY